MARQPAPRLDTFDYVGFFRYFLTMCTHRRAPVFVDGASIEEPLDYLLRTSTDEACAVIAYCFMPDHLHVLVEGRSARSDLRRFAKTYKQRSGYAWKQRHSRQLWQRSYYDHVLREDEDTLGVARYILENPVRAGICRDPRGYPLLGSATMHIRDLLGSLT
jgi:putative transposase